MQFQGSCFGTFEDPSNLEASIKEILVSIDLQKSRPVIFDVSSGSWNLSACVFKDKVYTICVRGARNCSDTCKIRRASNKHLYFIAMYLFSQQKEYEELLPFLSDYDILKLAQNREYFLLRSSLKVCKADKKEIPASLLTDPLAVSIYLEEGYKFSFERTYSHYKISIYEFYEQSILILLEKWNFERVPKKLFDKFFLLAFERKNAQILRLLNLHREEIS